MSSNGPRSHPINRNPESAVSDHLRLVILGEVDRILRTCQRSADPADKSSPIQAAESSGRLREPHVDVSPTPHRPQPNLEQAWLRNNSLPPFPASDQRLWLLGVLICLWPFALTLAYYHSVDRWWVAESSLVGRLSKDDFLWFQTLFLFGNCVLAGIGAEVFLGEVIIAPDMTAQRVRVQLWKYAQVIFPLMISISVYSRSVFGCIFVVFGSFKFGYPEISNHIWYGFYDRSNRDTIGRVFEFMNGVYLLSHHLASVMVVCGLITGQWGLSRYLLAGVFPPLVQHWVIVFKYYNRNLYILGVSLVELWFQIEYFGSFHHLENSKLQLSVSFFMAAHWGLFFVGGLDLLREIASKRRSFPNTANDSADSNNMNNVGHKRLHRHPTQLDYAADEIAVDGSQTIRRMSSKFAVTAVRSEPLDVPLRDGRSMSLESSMTLKGLQPTHAMAMLM